MLFQRHVDGRIWKYRGVAQCTAGACPGWTEIDHNPATRELVTARGAPSQRRADGRVWKYAGTGQCSASASPGWNLIDQNPATKDIVAAHGTLFQRHADGRVWKHNSRGTCTGAACPGWTEIDHNPRTAVIAGGADGFYQTHADGRIWKYDGTRGPQLPIDSTRVLPSSSVKREASPLRGPRARRVAWRECGLSSLRRGRSRSGFVPMPGRTPRRE